jgi:hypothetical protein
MKPNASGDGLTSTVSSSLQMKRSASFKLPSTLVKSKNPYQDLNEEEDIAKLQISGT